MGEENKNPYDAIDIYLVIQKKMNALQELSLSEEVKNQFADIEVEFKKLDDIVINGNFDYDKHTHLVYLLQSAVDKLHARAVSTSPSGLVEESDGSRSKTIEEQKQSDEELKKKVILFKVLREIGETETSFATSISEFCNHVEDCVENKKIELSSSEQSDLERLKKPYDGLKTSHIENEIDFEKLDEAIKMYRNSDVFATKTKEEQSALKKYIEEQINSQAIKKYQENIFKFLETILAEGGTPYIKYLLLATLQQPEFDASSILKLLSKAPKSANVKSLESYIIMPIQRGPRLVLLLGEIIKNLSAIDEVQKITEYRDRLSQQIMIGNANLNNNQLLSTTLEDEKVVSKKILESIAKENKTIIDSIHNNPDFKFEEAANNIMQIASVIQLAVLSTKFKAIIEKNAIEALSKKNGFQGSAEEFLLQQLYYLKNDKEKANPSLAKILHEHFTRDDITGLAILSKSENIPTLSSLIKEIRKEDSGYDVIKDTLNALSQKQLFTAEKDLLHHAISSEKDALLELPKKSMVKLSKSGIYTNNPDTIKLSEERVEKVVRELPAKEGTPLFIAENADITRVNDANNLLLTPQLALHKLTKAISNSSENLEKLLRFDDDFIATRLPITPEITNKYGQFHIQPHMRQQYEYNWKKLRHCLKKVDKKLSAIEDRMFLANEMALIKETQNKVLRKLNILLTKKFAQGGNKPEDANNYSLIREAIREVKNAATLNDLEAKINKLEQGLNVKMEMKPKNILQRMSLFAKRLLSSNMRYIFKIKKILQAAKVKQNTLFPDSSQKEERSEVRLKGG